MAYILLLVVKKGGNYIKVVRNKESSNSKWTKSIENFVSLFLLVVNFFNFLKPESIFLMLELLFFLDFEDHTRHDMIRFWTIALHAIICKIISYDMLRFQSIFCDCMSYEYINTSKMPLNFKERQITLWKSIYLTVYLFLYPNVNTMSLDYQEMEATFWKYSGP